MTRLCLGGSFNPIHYGHLRVAADVAAMRGFDRVVLIPSAQPPHKANDVQLAPAEDRLRMCRLAAEEMNLTPGQSVLAPPRIPSTEGKPGRREHALPRRGVAFEVDDVELRRSGPSYTIDTADELKRRGWATVSWMIGTDMLLYLPKWHRAEELIDQVEFIIVARPGWAMDWSQLPPVFHKLKANVVAAPLVDISATGVRRRVRAGEPIAGLTPPAVIAYIEAKRLYR